MTVCPVAIAVGCKKCPVFSVCPLKGVIGDHRNDQQSEADPPAEKAKSDKEKS